MHGLARSRIGLITLSFLALSCTEEASDPPEATAPADAPEGAESSRAGEAGEVAEPEPAPEPPPSGHAVARVGALMFSSSTGALGFELPSLGTGDTADVGVTVNVVGEKDGRIEVETLVGSSDDHHCAGTLSGLSDFRLRLFVARDDLLLATTEEVTTNFADGTAVRLARGVPIPPDARQVVASGMAVRVKVPAESLGPFHPPGEPFSADAAEGHLAPPEEGELLYGDDIVLEEDGLFREPGGVAYFHADDSGADSHVTVRSACIEVVARITRSRYEAGAPPSPPTGEGRYADEARYGLLGTMRGSGPGLDELLSDEEVWGLLGAEEGATHGVGGLGLVGRGGSGSFGAVGEMRTEFVVEPGTAVVWADGTPAGQVTAEHVFTDEPRAQSGNSCFDVPLTEAAESTVPLCVAPSRVSRREVPTSAVGTIGLGSLGTFGAGGTGLGGGGGGGGGGNSTSGTGLGGGGGGSGSGSLGGRGMKGSKVRTSKAAVKGSLDKDIIRRIVRAHINEVRHCYNMGLATDPSLDGRVAIQFTIGPTGAVVASVVQSDTLKDAKVSGCIAKAVKRWVFPKPIGGGNAVVTYPFVLTTE